MIRDIPEKERPLSEQYRLVAKSWVDADNGARMLEATKDAVLSEMIGRAQLKHPELKSLAAVERHIKASPEWLEYLGRMVKARTDANLKKLQLEYIRMRHQEWISSDANARAERKL